MAAHTYWRLNVSANNGGANLSVAELGLYVAGGASSATTGGTPTASTSNGSQTADKGFDASTSTYWQATTTSGQLQYQFASAVDITSYAVSARNDSNQPTQAPKTWTLQYSDDGSAWTTVDTVDKQTSWAQGDTRLYTVGENAGGTQSARRLPAQQPAYQAGSDSSGVRRIGSRSASTATHVSGKAKVNGVATAGLIVRAYDKQSGNFLGQATSAGDGTYSIECGGFTDVTVIFYNPTTYRMLGYDRVTPG